MSDEDNPATSWRVDIFDQQSVQHWMKVFDVSLDQLLAAVAEVGPLVRDIEVFLKDGKTL